MFSRTAEMALPVHLRLIRCLRQLGQANCSAICGRSSEPTRELFCQDADSVGACFFSSECFAWCNQWNVTTSCRAVSAVIASTQEGCFPALEHERNSSCLATCAATGAHPEDRLVCANVNSTCAFTSSCQARCSGWDVTASCSSLAQTIANDTTCFAEVPGGLSMATNASIEEVLMLPTDFYSLSYSTGNQTVGWPGLLVANYLRCSPCESRIPERLGLYHLRQLGVLSC